MGFVKYINVDQLSAKDRRDLEKLLRHHKQCFQDALDVAEQGLDALLQHGKPGRTRKRTAKRSTRRRRSPGT